MARGKIQNAVKMTQISISLPRELVAQIDKMAEADNRNRSNFIANTLRKMTEKNAKDS